MFLKNLSNVCSITNFFTADSNQSYKLAFILLIGFMVSLSLILINIGLPPINSMPWDVMVQLDAAWRVANGQVPNVEFHPLIPPLTILPTAFWMKIISPSASSIAYGNVLQFVILTPWAYFIARSRLSATNAFLFATFIGVLLVAPRPLGWAQNATTYAMLYNRQGWALLSMLFIEILVFHRKAIQPREVLRGVSSGILLALLLFCKPSFLVIGVSAILIRCFFFRPPRAWLISFLITLLFMYLCMHVFFRLSFFSYISEVMSIAPIYIRSRAANRFSRIILDNFIYLYITMVPLLMLINESSQTKRRVWLLFTVPCILVMSVFLCATSTQLTDIPGFFIAGLICLEYLRRESQSSGHPINSQIRAIYLYSILIIIPFLAGPILIKDLGSIAYSAFWHQVKLPHMAESQRFQSKTLSDFAIPEPVAKLVQVFPQKINDGLFLLRKYVSSDHRIFVFDFSNIFFFALELSPTRKGDVLMWGFNYTFDYKHFPNAETVFQGVNIVMIPESPDPTVNAMKYLYRNYLDKYFVMKENSKYWTLFTRR